MKDVPKTMHQPNAIVGNKVVGDGDHYKVLALGVEREDGKVYAHLASTTKFHKQRNGNVPVQIADFFSLAELKGIE